MAELFREDAEQLRPRAYEDANDHVGLKTLLSRLNHDASQLLHDELELAKLELREVAGALSSDVREAGRTLAKDLAKLGVALSLALMAGLALTAGVVLGIGRLLGGEYWAGGLITGVVLLIAAAISASSAASDAKESDSLRLENTRRTMQRDKAVLAREARETKEFARDEVREFREHATRSGTRTHHH